MDFFNRHWQRITAATAIFLTLIGFFSNIFGLYDHFFSSSSNGAKQETSLDPRKELQNLGISWEQSKFYRALNDKDVRISTLFIQGGMQLRGWNFNLFVDDSFDHINRFDPSLANLMLKMGSVPANEACPQPQFITIDDKKYYFSERVSGFGPDNRPNLYLYLANGVYPDKSAFVKSACAVPEILNKLQSVFEVSRVYRPVTTHDQQKLEDWIKARDFLLSKS